MRGGLDADERDSREQLFGQNNIDIHQKNIPQLLIDEVRPHTSLTALWRPLTIPGFPSVLYLSGSESHPVVYGSVLLLCCLHFSYFSVQHWDYSTGDKIGASRGL